MRSFSLFAALSLCVSLPISQAVARNDRSEARKYSPEIAGAQVETFRKVAERELKIWIFRETAAVATDSPKAAIVFFFGGGWTSGSPSQFVSQAKALTARGMVACVADYRVASRDGVKPTECVADAKACVRWIRTEAVRLGVDPDRIVAAGGSAGGIWRQRPPSCPDSIPMPRATRFQAPRMRLRSSIPHWCLRRLRAWT